MSLQKVAWFSHARFHSQIQPLRSGAWRFCHEPSCYDLAYRKGMASTFATQFSSGRPKVDMRRWGGTSRYGWCIKGWSYKRGWRSQKRKYKRKTGKAETGVSCSSLPMCLFPSSFKLRHHNAVVEYFVFIARSSLDYPQMMCAIAEGEIFVKWCVLL